MHTAPTVPGHWIAALLFSSILILIFNPFVMLTGNIKFALVVSIACLGFSLALLAANKGTVALDWKAMTFLILYAVMALRMNELPNDPNFDSTKAFIRPFVCLLLFISSAGIARICGVQIYTSAMAVIVGVVCLALLANYPFLIAPTEHGPVGDFTFDSYQQVSTVFGIVGIYCLFRGLRSRIATKNIAGGLAFCICSFVIIFVSPARGELIAFLVAIIATILPRTFIFVAFATVVSLPTVIAAMAFFGLPSMERFRIAVDLGWEEPRLILLRQTLTTLSDPFVFFLGGGANYFQVSHSLPESMHAHNLVSEAWTSGGVLFSLFTFTVFIWPVIRAYIRLIYRLPVDKTIFALSLFVLILSMKSTAFTSNWLLALSFPFFLYLSRFNCLERCQASLQKT